MMGHPELVKQVEREELSPLISPEGLEQLQGKYVQSVRVRITIVSYFFYFFFTQSLNCTLIKKKEDIFENLADT